MKALRGFQLAMTVLCVGAACGQNDESPNPTRDAGLDLRVEVSADGTMDSAIDRRLDGGAGDLSTQDSLSDSTPIATSMPLLATGQHLGMITTFESLPTKTATASTRDWKDAVSKGMSVGRIHLDWSDLEPTAGTYEKDTLADALDAMQQDGLESFVGIYVIDTLPDSLMPADLQGEAFDDPLVLERFAALLDWVVPMMVAKGGFALTVGNEPDGQITDDPSLVAPLARFVGAARQHVKTIDPRLALTITLTIDFTHAPYGPPLVNETDVVTVNYYPIDIDTMKVTDTSPAAVRDAFKAMLKAADGREIMIQELGCPAGPSSGTSIMETSTAKQTEFITSSLAAIRAEPRVRAAFWFQQVDWSPALASIFTDYLETAGLPAAGYAEWFETSGFLRYQDGERRETSWTAFEQALTTLKTDRDAL